MTKRPKYVDGIGVFKGAKETTAWIKVRLPKGGIFKGTSHLPGTALEIKLGKLASWTWDQLEHERDSFQGRADRGEP
ncbi:MAG: site-specific integrase, partial [Proteobacteria bacterium]|nr:site-specific integrase [Pseudomonadota bacterium]